MGNLNDNDIIIAVITVTVLFFLFSVFMIIYFLAFRRNKKKHQDELMRSRKEYEQQLLQVQIEIQETTYRHIAKELHDNVGQLLSTAKMLMGVTQLKIPQAPDTLTTANETLAKAIQELRLLSRSLDKEWLEQFDFLENLKTEVERINAGESVQARIMGEAVIKLKPEAQIILFRIVQEAMQNAIRHAHPSHIDISIQNGQGLEVKVINDGEPMPSNFRGMGTNNMRHRAKLFGGTVFWQSSGEDTVVTICLPQNQLHEN